MDATSIASTRPLHTYGNAQGDGAVAPMPGHDIGFNDVLRALNPLQHIPVVGHIWRQVTGQTIEPAFRVAGGALLGGPIGAILSAVGAFAEEALGFGNTAGSTAVASAAPAVVPAANRTGDVAAAAAPLNLTANASAPARPAAEASAPHRSTLAARAPALPVAALPVHAPAGAPPALRMASPSGSTLSPASASQRLGNELDRPVTVRGSQQAPSGARSRFDASDRPDPLYEAALRLSGPNAEPRGQARPQQVADARSTPAAAWSSRLPAQPPAADGREARGRDLQGNRLPGPTPNGEDFVARMIGGLAAYDRTARTRPASTER